MVGITFNESLRIFTHILNANTTNSHVIAIGLLYTTLKKQSPAANLDCINSIRFFGILPWVTIHDMRSHLLIALFLLNKFTIFFQNNLDGSLSRRAHFLIRVDFDLLLSFCNFPWVLLQSGKFSTSFRTASPQECFPTDVSSSFVRGYVWFGCH